MSNLCEKGIQKKMLQNNEKKVQSCVSLSKRNQLERSFIINILPLSFSNNLLHSIILSIHVKWLFGHIFVETKHIIRNKSPYLTLFYALNFSTSDAYIKDFVNV